MRNCIFELAVICVLTVIPASACAVQLANPATVYCLKKGGRHITVQTPVGTQGDCLLPDGRRIEEWELFRRDHRRRR